jgi:hypothetical protein
VSSIDPNSEMMLALDDAWAKHWSFGYSKTPNRKVFYKFARFIRYELTDDEILRNIDRIICSKYPDFQNYLVGE